MSVRSDVAAALKPLLPTRIKIIDVPRSLDGLEANHPVVVLYRESVKPAPNAMGTCLNSMSLWIINPGADLTRAENALDALLDEVLGALDDIMWLNWETAERSVFGDNQAPAYKITMTVLSTKE